MPYDRDEVLASTDLAALADEVLGPHKGRGPSATWPCPAPDHGNQTGRTPPVSLFRSPAGYERWRCHACGAGGTAADLMMVTQRVGFRDALEVLARRAGVAERDERPLRPRTPPRRAPAPEAVVANDVVEAHVAACEAYLWSAGGTRMRRWLESRGLGAEVLRANRVGADPGPQRLPRAPGLPRSGPAVVLPVLGADGRAAYLQARYLDPPGGRKYDNPAAALVGHSPRLANVRLPRSPTDPTTVLVCEGMPDALVAAQAGYRATAVLGAGLPDGRVAATLVRRFPTERLVVAFDADDRGRAGASRLLAALAEAGAADRVGVLDVPAASGDLNGWRLMAESAFDRELGAGVERVGPEGQDDVPTGLTQMLESIRDEHIVVHDPVLATRNLARLHRALLSWDGNGVTRRSPGAGRRSKLDEDLDRLASTHLVGKDSGPVDRNVSHAREVVASWSTADLEATRADRGLALAPTERGVNTEVAPLDRVLGIEM